MSKERGEKMKVLYVVVPCYNEEEVLEETTRQLKEKMESLIKDKKISKESRVMYVNDGSKDNTWKMIEEISEKEKLFTGISLSRNRGHQNALLGGLMTAKKLCWYSNKYGCRLTRWYKCNRWNDR